MGVVIAIDGPAGSGKGTVTKLIAEKLNLIYIDTGAMYRCVTLAALRNNIKVEEENRIEEMLQKISIELKKENNQQIVLLNGENVTEEIRTIKVDNWVAKFATLKVVRDKITPMQRDMRKNSNIIMEGRDIGTVVFPDADVKIYLEASVEERARRRYKQNIEKGINTSYEEVLQNIKERHKLETEREIAPLRQADDAILVDSSNMTIDEVVNKMIEIIKLNIVNL